jgi:hypothetical protein
VELHAAAHVVDACAAGPGASARTEPPANSPSAEQEMRTVFKIRLLACMNPPRGERS